MWPNARELPSPPGTRCDYFRDPMAVRDALVARMAESGVTAVTLPLTWQSIDRGDGRGPDFSRAPLLRGAVGHGYDVYLALATVWESRLTTPADLGPDPFDARAPRGGGPSPLDRTIARGKLIIDRLVEQVPASRDHVIAVALGSEVDLFNQRYAPRGSPWFFRRSGAPTPSFIAYRRLVHELAPYIRAKLPRAMVTTSFSAPAAGGWTLRPARWLSHDLDALGLTYYDAGPGSGRFQASLTHILALYPEQPVLFQEIGFAAPAADEALQVDFVNEVFRAWRQAGDRVPYAGFFSLHDWYRAPEPCSAPHICDPCAPGCVPCGTANHSLAALVMHDGLLRADDSPKPAWRTFKKLVTRRGGRR